jgi:hypothetical protein
MTRMRERQAELKAKKSVIERGAGGGGLSVAVTFGEDCTLPALFIFSTSYMHCFWDIVYISV